MTEAPLRILVLSCSLSGKSRSRALAQLVTAELATRGATAELVDLRDHPLPFCGDAAAWNQPDLPSLKERVAAADAILLAGPIYNYDLNAVAKNFIELTGSAWENKLVGYLCSAGGRSSYMAPMSLAVSLMCDFRCLIIPRFVYAVKDDFADGGERWEVASAAVAERVAQLAGETCRLAAALRRA